MNLKSSILRWRKIFTFYPLERIILLLFKGTGYTSFWSKLIPPPDLYKFNSIERVERNNINFELDKSCLMQWFVFWNFQEQTRKSLYKMVNKGDVILDVGTNIGETLLNFAQLTGEEGFVYGFEPDEKNFAGVQKNISLNKFHNVKVFNLGVSDKKERVKLFRVDSHNLGMNRILSESESSNFSDFTFIETDLLDNIVINNEIKKINLIKIDIEGYEMHALRGAKKVLEKFHPHLFIEVGYTRLIKNNTSPNEMVKFLEDLGYKIYHSETNEIITSKYDFSYLSDGGIDIYAIAEK